MKINWLDNSALIVIDMQRYFLAKGAPAFLAPQAQLIPNIVRLIANFRAKGLPIVFTRHAHCRGSDTGEMGRFWKNHLPWEGTRHAELINEISPLRNEAVITKTRYSAFEGTKLEKILQHHKVRKIVLCGVMTNLCVETTARHAFIKNFEVIIAGDACAANTKRHHLASLLNLSYGFALVKKTSEIVK